MHHRTRSLTAALMAASCLLAPQLASAATSKEAQLEARLEQLEAQMAQLRADLASARQEQAASAAQAQTAIAAATAKSEEAATKVAAIESKPQPDGIKSGATTIKLGGYLKMVASTSHFGDGAVATNSLGRDFYLPQTIPVGGKGTTDTDFTAKQTRLWLNLATTVAGHQVKGYLETDFQTNAEAAPAISGGGSQRTTNGYTLALRRAYLQVDRLLVGQEWTNFQYTAALPESTDYVGVTEGTVFVRQPQVRYTLPLAKTASLSLAVENPESATATTGSATLAENGADHMPDFTARLALTGKMGELSLAGLARQVRIEVAGVGKSQSGYGVSAAGKLWLNDAKTADVRVMATYGRDISRYVGLNFAPDAVYSAADSDLHHVDVLAALAAVRIPLSEQLRMNVMGSYQHVTYDGALLDSSIASYNKQAYSLAGNLFYSPVKNVDLGIEYRHGERELVSGAKGTLDRVEFAAKYGF